MMRTYTVRLLVSRKRSAELDRLLAYLCELYNAALQERRDAWKVCRKHISLYDQMRELTELRSLDAESAMYPVHIERDPLRRVNHAFQGFFRRVKSGDTPGYPRFRSAKRYDSFCSPGDRGSVEDDRIILQKIGTFRFKTRFRIKGSLKAIHVKKCGGKWTARIVCDIGEAPPKKAVSSAVGIDVGLTSLAVCSDGQEIINPRWTQREEDRLAVANRDLARKKRGSKNRSHSVERLRRVHQRIKGLRRAYLHGISSELVAKYDLIAYENLNIRGMARSSFAKSILDAAWGELIWQITYKAEKAGAWAVPINPRGTTQNCSGCGKKVPKDIRERRHDCPYCGLSLSRDLNAALNILALGESVVEGRQNA